MQRKMTKEKTAVLLTESNELFCVFVIFAQKSHIFDGGIQLTGAVDKICTR